MEPSANLKSQVTRTGKVTLLESEKKNHSNNFEPFKTLPKTLELLKNSRGIQFKMCEFWTSRSTGEEHFAFTLVNGCHLRLKLSEVLYSGMYCLFLLIRSISFQK